MPSPLALTMNGHGPRFSEWPSTAAMSRRKETQEAGRGGRPQRLEAGVHAQGSPLRHRTAQDPKVREALTGIVKQLRFCRLKWRPTTQQPATIAADQPFGRSASNATESRRGWRPGSRRPRSTSVARQRPPLLVHRPLAGPRFRDLVGAPPRTRQHDERPPGRKTLLGIVQRDGSPVHHQRDRPLTTRDLPGDRRQPWRLVTPAITGNQHHLRVIGFEGRGVLGCGLSGNSTVPTAATPTRGKPQPAPVLARPTIRITPASVPPSTTVADHRSSAGATVLGMPHRGWWRLLHSFRTRHRCRPAPDDQASIPLVHRLSGSS